MQKEIGFEHCCKSRKTHPYSLKHDPKPIQLSGEMEQIIKCVLWYVPNIESYQSPKVELVGNKVYSDFSFSFLLKHMNMEENKDVLWLDRKGSCIDDADWDYYNNEICINCQKAIIVRVKKLSKTNDFLRCVRNCVAHGHFSIVDDYLIGFNIHITADNPSGKKKAIIKIKPKTLLTALKLLMSPEAKEQLLGYALERIGYVVQYQSMVNTKENVGVYWDVLAEKDGIKYAIEIKDYREGRYIHLDTFKLEFGK